MTKFKARIQLELDLCEFELDLKLENFKISCSNSVRVKARVRVLLERFEHVCELLLEKCSKFIYLYYINKISRLASGLWTIEQNNLSSSLARKSSNIFEFGSNSMSSNTNQMFIKPARKAHEPAQS